MSGKRAILLYNITATFLFLNPDQFYSYQGTAYHTAAAAAVEHLAAEAGIHLEPDTAGTPDLKRQEQASSLNKNLNKKILKTKYPDKMQLHVIHSALLCMMLYV